MTRHAAALSLALASIFLGLALAPGARLAAAAPTQTQNVRSESYYDLDPVAGTLSVHVELTIRNAQSRDLKTLTLWAMPGATDVVVKKGAEVLPTDIKPASDAERLPALLTVTPARPLKPQAQVDLTLSYRVGAVQSQLTRLEPGAIEALLVGQGPGSFVFIDAPVVGDNYLDPGCLKVAEQPEGLRALGKERWVCGEATLIALSSDDPETLEACASLDDRCRQRYLDDPYSAFVQSISDPSLRGTLEADVPVAGRTVKLVLRYFKRDQAWATRQFDIARQALPLLEEAFAYPYPFERITMRQSHHIAFIGADGVAFSRIGEVLLATGSGVDDFVTVHELAHQWAGNQLETSWLWEGLAEYGTRVVSPALGVAPRDWGWEATGYTDPLATWHAGSSVRDPRYWYGKAGAFWFAYESALGGRENMRALLARIDDDPTAWPLDGRWFMDHGERVSGANLDALFLQWVFNPDTSAPLLRDRRAALDSLAALTARASTLGLPGTPADITANFDEWAFASIPAQLSAASRLLDAYGAVVALAKDTGHVLPGAVARSWGTATMAQTGRVIEDQRQALQALIAAAAEVQGQPQDFPGHSQYAGALAAYAEGRFDDAERLASGATTGVVDKAAATRLIEAANKQRATFHPSWLQKVGLLFADPAGEVSAAEKAFAAGDYDRAIELASGALKTWDGSQSRGLMLLALLSAVMGFLSFAVWWLLGRLERSAAPPPDSNPGHALTPPDGRTTSWRDWENLS
ncbi:MAG: hypothetical protein ACR2HN_06215 [Tepidiformaceae bacterium]